MRVIIFFGDLRYLEYYQFWFILQLNSQRTLFLIFSLNPVPMSRIRCFFKAPSATVFFYGSTARHPSRPSCLWTEGLSDVWFSRTCDKQNIIRLTFPKFIFTQNFFLFVEHVPAGSFPNPINKLFLEKLCSIPLEYSSEYLARSPFEGFFFFFRRFSK